MWAVALAASGICCTAPASSAATVNAAAAVTASSCYVQSMIDPNLQRAVVSFSQLRRRHVTCRTAQEVIAQVTLHKPFVLQWKTVASTGWRCWQGRPVLAPLTSWSTECRRAGGAQLVWRTAEDE